MLNRQDMLAASDVELSYIAAREGGVDASLAHKLAAEELAASCRAGTFPAGATVAERPRVIYDGTGAPLLHEVAVLDAQGATVGAIAVVCDESQGLPISHVVPGADRQERAAARLAASGRLGAGQSLRLVAECYPSVWLAPVELTGEGARILSLHDPATLEPVPSEMASRPLGTEELLSRHPEIAQRLSVDVDTTLAAVAAHRGEVQAVWREIRGPGARGGHETIAEGMLPHFLELQASGAPGQWQTGSCGPSAINWALGYLDFTSQLAYDPRSPALFEKLSVALGVENASDDPMKGITLPWHVDRGVEVVTERAWTADGCTPKRIEESVDADRPGISLRVSRFNGGPAARQWHYRDVAAYRKLAWGPFRWAQYGIWDPNWIDAGFPLFWETYNPLYHVFFARLVRRERAG
jgi:hypothetical protein